MKKLIIIPTIVVLSFLNQVALAVPKVSAEREADYIYGLSQLWGESIPYSYILKTINDADSQEIVRKGYELCDTMIEFTLEEKIEVSELIQAMSEDEDQEMRMYAQIGQVALNNLCPYVK